MYTLITTIPNPYIRRTLILVMLVIYVPGIVVLLLAETLWETFKAGAEILTNMVSEVKPRLLDLYEDIKRAW
jgi:hypothetical protein